MTDTPHEQTDDRSRGSLNESNDLKDALNEHAIVTTTDAQGKIVFVTDKFCAISQYSRDELLGQNHRIVNSGHHTQEFIRDLWSSITRGHLWQGEIKNKAKDGSFFWVDTTIVPFLNDDGKPRQFIAISANITEYKQAEDALHESERQFQTMANAIPQLAWMADADGFIFWYNRRWYEYTDTTPQQMEGWGWQSVHDPDMLPTVMERWKAAIATGQPFDMEFPLRAADGHYGWFLTRVVPIKNDSGEVVRWFGTNTDVSEQRRSAEEIRQLNENLERRVSERTAELEAANTELEAFSYSVSHDLRTPLRAVDGYAQVVLEDFGPQLPEEARQRLQIIRQSAQRLGSLIDDLLNFSQLGRQPVQKRLTQTELLVRATVAELKTQHDSPNIRINIGELPPCHGDPGLLKQVWVNLLSNAIKYSSKRDDATVEIGCVMPSGEQVFFIRDNGAGFDMRYADKLFGVFQRLHRAEDYEGTGVGLAIVKRIVQRHGGRIWAESVVDQGSTFYFTLAGE